MRSFIICTAVLALAACHKPAQQAANEVAPAAEAGPQKGVDRSHKGQAIPFVKILDPMSEEIRLDRADGRPMLVNLWASWCAPCIKELPTLQRLREQRGTQLVVVPLNQGDGPRQSVEAFLKGHKLSLPAYRDPKMALSAALGPDTVLPTTILYDASGKEVWRYVGDLDWTSPEAAKLLSEAGAAPKSG
jgi:thiol-disulfide isomerase/thioredoxin